MVGVVVGIDDGISVDGEDVDGIDVGAAVGC